MRTETKFDPTDLEVLRLGDLDLLARFIWFDVKLRNAYIGGEIKVVVREGTEHLPAAPPLPRVLQGQVLPFELSSDFLSLRAMAKVVRLSDIPPSAELIELAFELDYQGFNAAFGGGAPEQAKGKPEETA